MDTKTLVTVNSVAIQIIDEGVEKLVPVKPICEALEINYSTQVEKIKEHPILSSTIPLRGIVAADGKEREMLCLPLQE